MDSYQLPDGRQPLRFDKGRAAFYIKARGEGEVRYLFSMIKFLRTKRPRLSDEQLSEIRKKQAEKFLKDDPQFYSKMGKVGGKVTKHDRKDSSD